MAVYKILVIGDDHVGKTSLIRRAIVGAMDAPLPTSTAFQSKLVTVGSETVKLLVWDMGDQSRFWEIRETFYKTAHAAVLVYDVTSPSSFFNLMHWRDETQSSVPLIPTFVAGNKIDLVNVVPPEEVQGWSRSLGMRFLLTSAKTGEQVEPLFQALAEAAINEQKRREERHRMTSRLTRP
jgi:small GTP-binding protein